MSELPAGTVLFISLVPASFSFFFPLPSSSFAAHFAAIIAITLFFLMLWRSSSDFLQWHSEHTSALGVCSSSTYLLMNCALTRLSLSLPCFTDSFRYDGDEQSVMAGLRSAPRATHLASESILLLSPRWCTSPVVMLHQASITVLSVFFQVCTGTFCLTILSSAVH